MTPELGALLGAVVVFVFFAVQSPVFRSARGVANWLDPASTLGIMAVAVSAAEDAGSEAQIATFDLNEEVITGIQDGTISFAVDQQQYEQGYLPIVMLKLYAENLNTVGGGQPVLTGPGIVDADNVDEIADLASAGTR